MSQPGAALRCQFLVKKGLEGVNPDALSLLGFVDGVPMLDMERDVLEDIKLEYQDVPVEDHLETIFDEEVKTEEPEEVEKETPGAAFAPGQKVIIKVNSAMKSVIFNHKTGKVEIPSQLPSLQVKPSLSMRHRPAILKAVRGPCKYEITSKKAACEPGMFIFANKRRDSLKEQAKLLPVKENIEFNSDHDYSVKIRDVPPEKEEGKPNVVLCYAPGRSGGASGVKEEKVMRSFSLVMDNNFHKLKTLKVSSLHSKGPVCKKDEQVMSPEVKAEAKKLKTYEIVKPRKSPEPQKNTFLFMVPRKEAVFKAPPPLEHAKGQEHKCTQAGVQRKDAETNTEDWLLDSLVEQRALELARRNRNHKATNTDFDEFAISSPLSSLILPDDFLENLDDITMPVPGATLLDISQGRGKAINGCRADARSSSGTPPADRWKLHLFEDLKSCQKFDASGNMPLHNAVIQNNSKLVRRQCLALKIRRVDVNVPNHSSYTALQLALLHDVDPMIIQLLLSSGADTSVVDSNGNNILHLCVSYSNEMALKSLLEGGVQADINECNFEGFTPLIVSTMYQKYMQTDYLLSAGADPNISDKKSGRTPLFHAVENNDGEMVRLLLNYKAQTKMKNYFGTSPYDAMFELDTVNPQIQELILHNSDGRKYPALKRKGGDADKTYGPKRARAQMHGAKRARMHRT